MKLERYALKTEKSKKIFEFVSEGPKGEILKLVQFEETQLKGFYILSLVDKDPNSGKTDDRVVSNNEDRDKILATVVETVYTFTKKYPQAFVYAMSSTNSRNRLYAMALSKYLAEGRKDFNLYGKKDEEWEVFEKGTKYDAFVAKRKNI